MAGIGEVVRGTRRHGAGRMAAKAVDVAGDGVGEGELAHISAGVFVPTSLISAGSSNSGAALWMQVIEHRRSPSFAGRTPPAVVVMCAHHASRRVQKREMYVLSSRMST